MDTVLLEYVAHHFTCIPTGSLVPTDFLNSYQSLCWPSLHTVVLYISDWSPAYDNPCDQHAETEHTE